MEGTAHSGETLDYISITPTGYEPSRAYPILVLIHGYGASMYDLAGLAPAISETGYIFLCPNGPVPLDIGFGQIGYGWAPGGLGTEEDGQRAEDALDAFLTEAGQQYGLEDGNLALIGFSQGGGLSYRYGLTHASKVRGVAALSGSIPQPALLNARLPVQRQQPIFIGHGAADEVISVESGRAARAQLAEWGYTDCVYQEYDGAGHEITQAEIADVTEWLSRVLPPAPPQTPPGVSPGGIILP